MALCASVLPFDVAAPAAAYFSAEARRSSGRLKKRRKTGIVPGVPSSTDATVRANAAGGVFTT